MKMLRQGTYYEELKTIDQKTGNEVTEIKKFILLYLKETPDKAIKWNPKKKTCNKFYLKYRDLEDDVKFWKKLFKGCHKFGGIFG